VGSGQKNGSIPGGRYVHPDPVTDAALDWFVRLQDEDADPAVISAFRDWRDSDQRHAEAYAQLERMHASPALKSAIERDARRLGLPPSPARASGDRRRPRPVRSRWKTAIMAMAAALAVAVGVQQYPRIALWWQADHLTATGERQAFSLPDGSSVTLNTASAIAINFEDGQRHVDLLEGEAFFDVRHDPAHPFVVASQFGEVEVRGTAFSVRRDPGEDVVVLERGRVEVSRLPARTDQAELQPGQMIIATATALSPVAQADPSQQLAWRDGRVAFHDQPFGAALAELRRYYPGRVIVTTARLDDVFVNGNYRIDDAEAAIRTLGEAAGASVTHLPGGILILR